MPTATVGTNESSAFTTRTAGKTTRPGRLPPWLALLAGLGALRLIAPGLAQDLSQPKDSVAAPFFKTLSRHRLAISASRAEIQKIHRELARPDLEEPAVRGFEARRLEQRGVLQASLRELERAETQVTQAIGTESAEGIVQLKSGQTSESPAVKARVDAITTFELIKGEMSELMVSGYDFLVQEERIYQGLAEAHRSRFGFSRWRQGWVRLSGLGVALLGCALLAILHLRSRKTARSTLAALTGAGAGENILANNYRIIREVAQGGWATVYEAVDLALQRKVAVKKLHSKLRRDPKQARQFLNEARLVAALKHPKIVEIHHILEEAGEIYLVFEYVEGETLFALLKRVSRLGLAEAKGSLAEVCEALGYAHGQGIIHRDLKPTNIMITPEGSAKVMDFGIAHQAKVAAALSRAAAIGTPQYMAPEQETGHVVLESDLYALGVCLYEMLTGWLPFEGPDFAAQKRSLRFLPATQRNPALPKEVDAVLHKALQPDFRNRFRSASEFSRWLS